MFVTRRTYFNEIRPKYLGLGSWLAMSLALWGCSPASEPAASVPSTDTSQSVSPKQAAPQQPAKSTDPADWTAWPRADGDWVYRQDERGSIALFGPVGRDAIFSIRCDSNAGLVILSRQGSAPENSRMILRANEGMAAVDVRPVDGSNAYMAAGLTPYSQILDQLAFSRGHFAVEMAGVAPVKIPVWPEFAHVVEDCRG